MSIYKHILLHRDERGATAIFIVVFASLLLLVITVGFVRLMVQEQSRSTDSELSQSAYDAALSGVEDAKRVMTICDGSPASPACASVASQDCKTVQTALGIGSPSEVLIKTQVAGDTTSSTFDQAYTCVKVIPDTPSISGNIPSPNADVAYLSGVTSFSRIRISWFTRNNAANLPLGYNAIPGNLSLPADDGWNPSATTVRPPLLRLTYIPNSIGASHDTEDKTVYLFPERSAAAWMTNFSLDSRRSGGGVNIVAAPACVDSFTVSISQYACSATIQLPVATTESYLYLASQYGMTDYELTLLDDANNVVNFKGVQPRIDATGRAGNVFRRVVARVEKVNPDAPSLYPRATVDITNNFCKAFSVSIVPAVYTSSIGTCRADQAGP